MLEAVAPVAVTDKVETVLDAVAIFTLAPPVVLNTILPLYGEPATEAVGDKRT